MNLRSRAMAGVLGAVALGGCFENIQNKDCDVGYSLAANENFDEAIVRLDRCLSTTDIGAKERRKALYARAWAYGGRADHLRACADFDEAFKLQPATTFDELINASLSYRKASRFSDSLAMARGAVAVDDGKYANSMMAQYHLGWALDADGRHLEAVSAFTEGLRFQPDFGYALWRRALSDEALGRKEDAKLDLVAASPLFVAGNAGSKRNEMIAELLETYRRFNLPEPPSLVRH